MDNVVVSKVLNLIPNRMKCPVCIGLVGGQFRTSLVSAEDAAEKLSPVEEALFKASLANKSFVRAM